MIPTNAVEKSRVRTGYERVIAQYCGRKFAGVAEQPGEVTNIDKKAQLIEVTYKDGTIDVFNYGEKYSEHEGVNVTSNLECNVTVGQKLKKGDIVMYDRNFFTYDKKSGQVDFAIGVNGTVAMMETDTTLEDATSISSEFAERIGITPTNTRVVSIKRNSLVHYAAKVGDVVKHTSNLLIFEEDATLTGGALFKGNDETLALLGDLNKRTPTAKFSGKITKIEAYYGGPIEKMHPSVQALVNSALADTIRKNRFAKGTLAQSEFAPPAALPVGSKFKGVPIFEDTVIFVYYIQETQNARVGDKVVFGNQLKCTVADVNEHPQYTESGRKIDALFSPDAAGRRICMSPMLTGISNRIMEQLEQNIVDYYFEDKKLE